MADTKFTTPYGTFNLELHSRDGSGSLRAWDAADEYLLQELYNSTAGRPVRAAIFNESRGGLAVPLSAWIKGIYVDSFTSRSGIRRNLNSNGAAGVPPFLELRELPESGLTHVLIKIPASTEMLEDQLLNIRQFAGAGVRIMGAGMTRHIHSSTIDSFRRILGPTETSLARKKARLIFSAISGMAEGSGENEYAAYSVDGIPEALVNLPGVFSRNRLDLGTRFFLDHIKLPPNCRRIADFGCGNGVLSIRAAIEHPAVLVSGVDDSAVAVESARENCRRNGVESRVEIVHGMSLRDAAGGSFDCILSNPPCHQGRATSIDVALSFFQDARNSLNPGGELQIVANRHLGYHAHLKGIFGNVETIAENSRYTVLRSRK